MIVVGCIRFFISSLARRRSSEAIMTTDVVPSPTCFVSASYPTDVDEKRHYLLVLLLRQVHQDLACGMFNVK